MIRRNTTPPSRPSWETPTVQTKAQKIAWLAANGVVIDKKGATKLTSSELDALILEVKDNDTDENN